MNDTTTPEPMNGITSSVGPEAQLMLLQLLTQVKFLQEICKPNNESSPGEEALRTLARDAIEREQDTKRQLETLERTSEETITNLTAEINDITQQLNITQELNKNLSVSLRNKEDEMQGLQEKLEEKENNRAKKLQEVLSGQTKEEALIEASKKGNVEKMSVILDNKVNLEYAGFHPEWTALEWAVAFGHTQACRLLLERGANPHRTYIPRVFGTSTLHWPLRVAARFGHMEIASLLLQYGADIPNDYTTIYDNNAEIYNNEPETIAKDRGFLELAQMLCEWKNDNRCHYLDYRHC